MTAESGGAIRASAKILVAGGRAADASTLVRSVSEIQGLPDDLDGALTWDFGRVNVDGALRLYLFALPEVDRFGFAWDQFLEGALGAVVLVDPERLSAAFSIVDFFESRDLPFVVVLAQRGGRPSVSARAVRSALDLDPDIAVVTAEFTAEAATKKVLLELLDVVLYRAAATG